MQLIKGLNQIIYFLLELSMIGALGYAGFQNSSHPYAKYLLGIGLPLIAIVLWGLFAAPRSAYRLDLPYRSLFALALFSLSFFMLYRTGQTSLAIILGCIAFVSVVVSTVTETID